MSHDPACNSSNRPAQWSSCSFSISSSSTSCFEGRARLSFMPAGQAQPGGCRPHGHLQRQLVIQDQQAPKSDCAAGSTHGPTTSPSTEACMSCSPCGATRRCTPPCDAICLRRASTQDRQLHGIHSQCFNSYLLCFHTTWSPAGEESAFFRHELCHCTLSLAVSLCVCVCSHKVQQVEGPGFPRASGGQQCCFTF